MLRDDPGGAGVLRILRREISGFVSRGIGVTVSTSIVTRSCIAARESISRSPDAMSLPRARIPTEVQTLLTSERMWEETSTVVPRSARLLTIRR